MTNEDMVKKLVRGGYLKTPRIIAAFRAVDRADFVLQEHREEAYNDNPLPIGFGQTISQPLTVAFMLEQLQPQPGNRVLEIGAGSGWQAALLAHIVAGPPATRAEAMRAGDPKLHGPRGRVIAIERIPELVEAAIKNVSKYPFIQLGVLTILQGDGAKGYPPRAPFYRIIAAAAASKRIPVAWKEQLFIGGRLVAPVGDVIEVIDRFAGTNFNITTYEGFRFVPLISHGDGG